MKSLKIAEMDIAKNLVLNIIILLVFGIVTPFRQRNSNYPNWFVEKLKVALLLCQIKKK